MQKGIHGLQQQFMDTVTGDVKELNLDVKKLQLTCHSIQLEMTKLVQTEKIESRLRALEDAKTKIWTIFGVLYLLTVGAWAIYTKVTGKP